MAVYTVGSAAVVQLDGECSGLSDGLAVVAVPDACGCWSRSSPPASWTHLRVLAAPWIRCVLSPSRAPRTMSSAAVLARSTIRSSLQANPVDAGQQVGVPARSTSHAHPCSGTPQPTGPIAGSPVDTPRRRLATQALTTSACSAIRLSHHCSTPFSAARVDGPSCPQRPRRGESLPMQSLFLRLLAHRLQQAIAPGSSRTLSVWDSYR